MELQPERTLGPSSCARAVPKLITCIQRRRVAQGMSSSYHRVYHYRPDRQPRDLDTLVKSQMWSSSVDRLNDPFEFVALRALAASPDKQADFKRAGVTCFSRSLTNPLLWSHYAACHVGFVIGYDAAHSFFGGNQGLTSRFLLDVRYEDIVPTLEVFSVEELCMAAVLTKPTSWAYEQEVRLIKQQANQAFDVPKDTIKEIVLGAAMPQSRGETIVRAVRAAGIAARFGRMKPLEGGFGVRPEWLTVS